tara:strand:+ start:400 stop:1494 length:1095 start_codon:yes stop_codon:yes gene_type:complete
MVESTSKPLPEIQEYGYQNLSLASDIANMPYIPFQGNRTAEFDPMEQQAFASVAGLNQGAGAMDLGGGISQGIAQNFANQANAATPGAYNSSVQQGMAGYQNPYTNQVIGGVEQDLRQARDRTQRGIDDQLDASSFGGSRAAVASSLADETYMDSLAQASGQLRSQGFNTALQASQAGTQGAINQAQNAGQLGLTGAEQMRRSGLSRLERDLGISQAQQNAGSIQRGREQELLSNNYGDFLDEMNNPIRGLQIRSQQLGLTPQGQISRQPVMQQGGGAGSLLSGVGGLLSGFAAICWVAREVYGPADPTWLLFREWLLERGPSWLRKLYISKGEAFAEYISDKPRIKVLLRWVMDRIIAKDLER